MPDRYLHLRTGKVLPGKEWRAGPGYNSQIRGERAMVDLDATDRGRMGALDVGLGASPQDVALAEHIAMWDPKLTGRVLVLLQRASSHVYRQQGHGKHTQDRLDAKQWLQDLKAMLGDSEP